MMSKTIPNNPWTTISPEDYEGHMDSPGVGQLAFLSSCMKSALDAYKPEVVALIGCATGNGLAHIDTAHTKRTTVVDINEAFLNVVRLRYRNRLSGLDLVHADLNHCTLQAAHYSMVFAGLVFEFLPVDPLVKKISQWLRPGGILKVVLQMPSQQMPTVSDTGFSSLQRLNPIINLVDADCFRQKCEQVNLREIEYTTECLPSGKSFYVGVYRNG